MNLSRILFVLMIFCAGNCFAQETKWTRIEFEKNAVSVSVPDGFLVDTEKNDKNRKYRIFAYNSVLRIELSVYKNDNPKEAVEDYRLESNDSDKIEIDKVLVRRLISSQNNLKTNVIIAGTKKYVYAFHVQAEKTNEFKILCFVDSFKINGKSVFPQQIEPLSIKETPIIDSDLKSSAEVLTSWNRKLSENDDYVKVANAETFLKPNSLEIKHSREIIFLENLEALMKKNTVRFIADIDRRVKPKPPEKVFAVVSFLKSGEIGDVRVFSTADEKTTKSIVKAIRGIKFLPAQINGVNSTSENLLSFTVFNGDINTKIVW